MTICIFASITAKPEHRDDVLQALRLMVEQSRAEPGNLRYDLFVRTDEPAVFELFELYSDETAVEAHRQSPPTGATASRLQTGWPNPPK